MMIWSIKKLGEVCEILIGGTPRRGVVKYWKNGNLPWVSIADLSKSGLVITNTREKITETGAKESNVKLIPKDSLIFSFKLSIGKMAFAGMDLYTNEAIAALIEKDKRELDKKFLYYFLQQAVFDTVQKAVKGNTLNKEKIKKIEIPLPSLSKQKRIVKRIEELFAKIDEAEKLREESKKDAEALIPVTLHKIFTEGKEKGWKEKKLIDITKKTKTINPKDIFRDNFPYIDITSVSSSQNGFLEARILNIKKAPSRAKKLVKKDDIIFATTRPYLKNIAFIGSDLDGAIASTGFCIIRSNKKILDSKYAFLTINSNKFVEEVSSFQKGATYPAVSNSVIFNRKILLPPLSEQKKIVAELDVLSEKVQKIEELQKQTAQDFKALRQSILHQAFSGKL